MLKKRLSKQKGSFQIRGYLGQWPLPFSFRHLRKSLPDIRLMRLQYAMAAEAPQGLGLAGKIELEDELVGLILDLTFVEDRPPVRDKEEFERRIDEGRARLTEVADQACALVREGRVKAGVRSPMSHARKRVVAVFQTAGSASSTSTRPHRFQ